MKLFTRVEIIVCLCWLATLDLAGTKPPEHPNCLPLNRIAYREIEPYVLSERPDVNHTSIIITIFNHAMQNCCRGSFDNEWSIKFNTQDEALDLIKNLSIDFIMPIQADLKSKAFLRNPFVTVVESPGIAFYVIPDPSAAEAIVTAITSTWPLMAVMFMLVAVAGTLFWLLETITLQLLGEQCGTFYSGFLEGVWWAFVSMTTVGYGDICPKTKPGKVFSMIWVIMGVACCALFTSYITSILTSVCMSEGIVLQGNEIGVLAGSEEERFAIKKSAIVKPFETMDEVIGALRTEEIKGALIDSYVASEQQDKLKEFRLQKIIEHITAIGIVFQNDGMKFSKCIRDYIYSRQSEVFGIIMENVVPIKIGPSSAEENSKSLIDSRSAMFNVPITITVVALILFIIIGVLWDCTRGTNLLARLKGKKHLDQFSELTLTQLRMNYRAEMQKILSDMQKDLNVLNEKCATLADRFQDEYSGLVRAKPDER